MAKINKAMHLTVVPYTNDNLDFLEGYEGIATQGANKEFATIRVQQKTFATAPTGVIVKVQRTARLTVAVDFLEDLEEGSNVNELFAEYGLPMKRIIVEESFEPFYEGQGVKVNPDSHATAPGEEILVDGQNIYYQTHCVDWFDPAHDVRITAVEEKEPKIAGAE